MKHIPDFTDQEIKCRRCRRPVGKQMLQGQCLLLKNSNIGVWNFLRWQCISCGINNSWQSPHLPEEEKYPDAVFDVKPPKNIKIKSL